MKAGVHQRNSLSRSRKRTPASTPRSSGAIGRSGRWTNAATSANDDEIARRVEVEHVRGPDHADQHAGDRRAEEDRQPVRGLEERRSARDLGLVLADELRHDRALHAEIRRDEDARRGDECEQDRERQQALGVEDRDRREQRRAGEVAREHRPPRADASGDRAAPEPEHGDRQDLRDDHPRHPLRRAGRAEHEPRQGEPGHLRPEGRDDLRAEERGEPAVPEEAHVSAAAPKLTTMCRVPRRSLAAAELVEQRLEALAELFELGRCQLEQRRRRLRGAAPAGGQLVLVPQRVAEALLLARNELVAEDGRFEAVRVELDARCGRAPRPLAAGAALALLDEAPFGERAQVVAAGGGAVVDDGGTFGRRRLLDRVQEVEQREACRVRERAHRARVVQ